jgi:ABC-type dipeptide/oligopeptide/nickel transport system ATPase component
MTLAEVRDLTVRFVTREAMVHAVYGVSFTVEPGKVAASPTSRSR